MARLVFLMSLALGVSLAGANPWGSEASRDFARKAYDKLGLADYRGALSLYEEGYQQSLSTKNIKAQIKFLNGIGGCHYTLFQFQSALRFLLEARQLAERHPEEVEEHGAILFNLASLYLATSNVEAAGEAARQGADLLENHKPTYYRSRLNLIRAVIASRTRNWQEAVLYYAEAIEAADETKDDSTLGLAFNQSGTVSLARGDLQSAEHMFLQAYKLRKLRRDPELVYTYLGLGELALAMGKLDNAYLLAARAEELAEQAHHPIQRHLIYGLRARTLSRQGQRAAAHREYLRTFASIRKSRADVLPADFFRVNSEASFEELYDGALRNALDWQKQGGAPTTLAPELWLSTEEWKASVASRPRQLQDLASRRLGAEYWQTLAEFRQMERQSFQKAASSNAGAGRLPRLRVRLAEMESYAGIRPLSSIFSENFSTLKALILFRDSLDPDTALVRFHVGPRVTLRWTLTRRGLEWKEVQCSQEQLSARVGAFNEAVRSGSDGERVRKMGRQLFESLFGDISLAVRQAKHWLLAFDGALLQMPAAVLSTGEVEGAGGFGYLMERHSLELVTGAQALLSRRLGKWDGPFVGVGDAIYNTADPRWGKAAAPNRSNGSVWSHLNAAERPVAAQGISLPRLASSRLELQSSAKAWGGSSRLLMGPEANRQKAVESIESGAAIVHFATHFLQHGDSPDRALLVLSLDAKGQPDFFSPSDAIHVKVPDSLVVLSGCHSSAGALIPAAGLIGMTRAWLMAGASGVVASLWPTPDDNGAIFQAFYKELQSEAPSTMTRDGNFAKESVRPRGTLLRTAAEALRRAQLEMLRTHSWRALPKYWGTYQLTGRTM